MSVPRIRVAVIAGCIAVGSIAVAGCGGGSSSSTAGASGASGASGLSGSQVSASDYVASVCGAVVDFEANTKSKQPAFSQAVQEAARKKDLGAMKDAVSKFTSELSSASRQVATKIKGAGTPDVPNGDQISAKLNGAVDQLTTAVQGVEKQANALQTSSVLTFDSKLKGWTATLSQQFTHVGSQAGAAITSDSELTQAATQNPDCDLIGKL